MPSYYREKIGALAGVAKVVPMDQLWSRYRDEKPENAMLQIGSRDVRRSE